METIVCSTVVKIMSQVGQDLWLIVKVKSNVAYNDILINKSVWFNFDTEAVQHGDSDH
jgi:hypothetical protein